MLMQRNPQIIKAVEERLAKVEAEIFNSVEAADLLGRNSDTISMHARQREDTPKPIGRRISGRNWAFTRQDVLELAKIIAQGSGRKPYKYV